jgi:hypothetical protein
MAVIVCSSCAKRYKVADSIVGSSVKCKACGTKFTATDAAATSGNAGGQPDILAMSGLGQPNSNQAPPPSPFSGTPSPFDAPPAQAKPSRRRTKFGASKPKSNGSFASAGFDEPGAAPTTMYQPTPSRSSSKGDGEGLSGANIALRLVVVAIGLGLLWASGYYGWELVGSSSIIPNNSSAKRASGTPVRMDLATLVTQGPGNNRYIELTGWDLAENGLVAVGSHGKYESEDDMKLEWAYQGIVVPGHSTPVAILRSTVWKLDSGIAEALAKPTVSGFVIGRGALSPKEINQLNSQDMGHITKHAEDLWVIDVGRELPQLGTMKPSATHAQYASAVGMDTSETDKARRDYYAPLANTSSIGADVRAKFQALEDEAAARREARRAARSDSSSPTSSTSTPAPASAKIDLSKHIANTPQTGPRATSKAPDITESFARSRDPARYAVRGRFFVELLEGYHLDYVQSSTNPGLGMAEMAGMVIVPDGATDGGTRTRLVIAIDTKTDPTKKFPAMYANTDLGSSGIAPSANNVSNMRADSLTKAASGIAETKLNGLPMLIGDTPPDILKESGIYVMTIAGYDGDYRITIEIVTAGADRPHLDAYKAMVASLRRASKTEIHVAMEHIMARKLVDAEKKVQDFTGKAVTAATAYHLDVPSIYTMRISEALEHDYSISLSWYRDGQNPTTDRPDISMVVALGGGHGFPTVITDSTQKVPEDGIAVVAYGAKKRKALLGGKSGVAIEFETEPSDNTSGAGFACLDNDTLIYVSARWNVKNTAQRRAMEQVLNSFRASTAAEATQLSPAIEQATEGFVTKSMVKLRAEADKNLKEAKATVQ